MPPLISLDPLEDIMKQHSLYSVQTPVYNWEQSELLGMSCMQLNLNLENRGQWVLLLFEIGGNRC